MGGNVADYAVVRRDSFAHDAEGDNGQEFRLAIPGGAIESQESLLSYTLEVSEMVDLSVSLNGERVDRLELETGFYGIQKVCNPYILRAGNNNLLVFKVASGGCKIRDIVIWFKLAT